MNKNEPTGLPCNLVPSNREAEGLCMVHKTPLFKIGGVNSTSTLRYMEST